VLKAAAITGLVGLLLSCQPARTPATAAPAAPTGLGPYYVDISEYKFKPATLTIPLGATVIWTNRDIAAHTVTSNETDEKFDSHDIPNQGTFSHTYHHVGTFPYFCLPHTGMQATIIVQ
jgi:plastocyanin